MAKSCPHCGTQNSDTGKFCKKCGAIISEPQQPAAPIQQPPQQQYASQPNYQQPQYTPPPPVKKKSKIPIIAAGAAALAIVLVVILVSANDNKTESPSESVSASPVMAGDPIIGTWILETIETPDYTMGWEEYKEFLLSSGHTELVMEMKFTDDGKAAANFPWEKTVCTWRNSGGGQYVLSVDTNESTDIIEMIDGKLIVCWEVEDYDIKAFFVKASAHEPMPEPTPEPARASSETYLNAPQGSAKFLEGKNLLVTIFVDIEGYEWSWEDFEAIKDKYILAKDYLETQAKQYGKDLELIWDFEAYPDLIYKANAPAEYFEVFGEGVSAGNIAEFSALLGTINSLNTFIEDRIPYLELADKYGTDSIAYCFQVKKWAAANYEFFYNPDLLPKSTYHEKFVLFSMEQWGAEALPHELLHTFGAVDLYLESPTNGVSNALVEHARVNYTNDIMGNWGEKQVHDKVAYEIGPVTAYCLGWLDDIPETGMFPELKRHTPAAFYDHKRSVDPDTINTGNTFPSSGGSIRIDGITEFEFSPDHSDVWIITSSDNGDCRPLLQLYDSEKNRIVGSRMNGSGYNAYFARNLYKGESLYIVATFVDAAVGDNAKGSYTLTVRNPESLPGNGGTGYMKDGETNQYFFTPDESGTWEIRVSENDGSEVYFTIYSAVDDKPRLVYSNNIGQAWPANPDYNDYISVNLKAGQKYMLVLDSMDRWTNYSVTVSKK